MDTVWLRHGRGYQHAHKPGDRWQGACGNDVFLSPAKADERGARCPRCLTIVRGNLTAASAAVVEAFTCLDFTVATSGPAAGLVVVEPVAEQFLAHLDSLGWTVRRKVTA